MSVALQFNLTVAGQAAAWNAKKTGLSLDLTHIQMGSGNRVPDGLESALVQPKEVSAIAGGSQVAPNQVRMSALFSSNVGYEIREVGLWSGNPANSASVLVGYWSQAAGVLAVKAPGVDFVFSHDMVLDGAVPGGSLNVLVDAAQAPLLAMIAAHETKTDPHLQYVSKTALQGQSFTAFTTTGAAGALELAATPAVTSLNPGLRLRVKFSVNATANDRLNVDGLGSKPIKEYDNSGAKVAARFFAGQIGDVEFDGVDFVLLDTLPPTAGVPVGMQGLFAGPTPPVDWLKADGRVLPRSVYSALFASIGTLYGGGDGSTTFAIPDWRGVFFRGLDDGRGLDTGRGLGTYQADENKAHAHLMSFNRTSKSNNSTPYMLTDPNVGENFNGTVTLSTTASGGTESRPRNVALLACIKFR